MAQPLAGEDRRAQRPRLVAELAGENTDALESPLLKEIAVSRLADWTDKMLPERVHARWTRRSQPV